MVHWLPTYSRHHSPNKIKSPCKIPSWPESVSPDRSLRRLQPRTPAETSWVPSGWCWTSHWSCGASRSSGREPAAPTASLLQRRPQRRTAGTLWWGWRAAQSARCLRLSAGNGSHAVAGQASSKFQHHSRVGQQPVQHRRRHSLCSKCPPQLHTSVTHKTLSARAVSRGTSEVKQPTCGGA